MNILTDETKEINSELEFVEIENEEFFKISNIDTLRPFFMSIVSDSNHWMFISSNGGLTAGRKNSEYALFPYYTDDKITELADTTGSKTIFQILQGHELHIWEPFSNRCEGRYLITRNLYKNKYGNKIIFEEINHDLKLTFKYQWSSTNIFGFVRKSTLQNNSDQVQQVTLVDGIQNILPFGVNSDLQIRVSNLVDAYKRNELHKTTGLGIYALSAIIVDKAEPSEALKANVVWSLGLKDPKYLLSSLQLEKFRSGASVEEEFDIKAEKGAYFVNAKIELEINAASSWQLIANVNQDHDAIVKLISELESDHTLEVKISEDIELGSKNLIELVASSDGVQQSADDLKDTRHFSNTLFNIMRGGIFDDDYQVEKWDFLDYLERANNIVFKNLGPTLEKLPAKFDIFQLKGIADKSDDKDFKRLCIEYLPLKFSRRHGDPSRPWNRFSINTRSEVDGSKILDYEGNWRDIFQNWEALAHSFPEYIESMISKFLNASTFDGYNPYRVTKGGFDWEIIEEHDPWSYIGYWGDHQIIYLLKFLEFMEDHKPGKLSEFFDQEIFVYANVPYKIRSYSDVLENSKDTIDFDYRLNEKIHQARESLGADGALLTTKGETIYHVNLIEKILATTLSKLSNFIPEGGIWMNTQRPEWNDANNALVGNGVSMVTLCYLRRFFNFFEQILGSKENEHYSISKDLAAFFYEVHNGLKTHSNLLHNGFSDGDKKSVTDSLGNAGSTFRQKIYNHHFSGNKEKVSTTDLLKFTSLVQKFLNQTIKANKRADQMYHAYNIMSVKDGDKISITHLDEMLEGQVAALSSGCLSASEAVELLDSMRQSKLYRQDQNSYMLYPAKELPRFLEKNTIPKSKIGKSELLTRMVSDGNTSIVIKDIKGDYHFNGNFNNADSLKLALDSLNATGYGNLAVSERDIVLGIFEDVFNHKAFTGRSGTFYGYEGLGSIYWHMVSKLLLAVGETYNQALKDNVQEEILERLKNHFHEINEGIGVHKSPAVYGAFSTDPYSHTPGGKGAQQPGMTGQVKEDILSRFIELGLSTTNGKLKFEPMLLDHEELLNGSKTYKYFNINKEFKEIALKEDSICFSYCQVPIVYQFSTDNEIIVVLNDGSKSKLEGRELNSMLSDELFRRTGKIEKILVNIEK